jgi:outer membrane protein assembly factor BamB
MIFIESDVQKPVALGSLSHDDFPFLKKEKLYYCLVFEQSILLWSKIKKIRKLRRFDVGVFGSLTCIWSIESGYFPVFSTGFSADGMLFNIDRDVYEFKTGRKVFSVNISQDFSIYDIRELHNGFYCARYYLESNDIFDDLCRSSIVVFDNGFNVIRFLSVNIPRPYYESKFVFGIEEAGKLGVDYSRNLVCVDVFSGDFKWRYDCLVSREISSHLVDINVSMADQKLIINVDSFFYVIDKVTGQEISKIDIRKFNGVLSLLKEYPEKNHIIRSHVVCENVVIFEFGYWGVRSGEGILVLAALDVLSKNLLWAKSCSELSQLVVLNSESVACTVDGLPSIFNVNTGNRLWRAPKKIGASGGAAQTSGSLLCFWNHINEALNLYFPVEDGALHAVEYAEDMNFSSLKEKLMSHFNNKKGLNPKVIEVISKLEEIDAVNGAVHYSYVKLLEAAISDDKEASALLMNEFLKLYPDLDDSKGYGQEFIRAFGERLLEAKAVLKYEPINKAARSGCNGYVTSVLMELAELTGNKKRESLYKWALREHSGSDEVMDAYDRLHGGAGYF